MKKSRFTITGMTCTACVGVIEKSVSRLDGIKTVDVNLLTGNMTVTYDEKLTGDNRIIAAVEEAGYNAAPFSYDGDDKKKKTPIADYDNDSTKSVLIKLIASSCLLFILLVISLWNRFSLPMPEFFSGNVGYINLAFTEFLITLPIIFLNQRYFKNGFKALIKRAPNMNTLIATGATASLLYSVYLMFALINAVGQGHQSIAEEYCTSLYFESAGIILTVVTIGKYIESYSKSKASDVVTKLVNLAPKTAVVLRDGEEIEIPASEVVVDDIVVVKAGQTIPADGVIIDGAAAIDESSITGESLPIDKTVGENVAAATVNRSGYIKFRVKRTGQDTALANIIKIVENAVTSKAPISKLADKVSGVFVPIVMALALISLIVWSVLGYPFGFAISTAISVLVVSCPCALALATPASISVGMGLGAENGIIIKSAEPLQTAKRIDIVALDKTGIITEGHPKVTDVFPIAPLTEIQLAAIAAAMENMSEHPFAKAIVDFAHEQGIRILNADDFHALSGLGIEASMFGRKLYAGSLNFMQQNGIKLFGYDIKGASLAEKGKTPLYFSDDKKLLGMIAVEDTIKEKSFEAIEEFEKMGIEVVILTGDNKRTTKAIAKQLGINNAISEILPDEKEHEIRNLQAGGKKVAMIGDGINDAPALAAADIGIAIGVGTDIAVESADIILMRNELTDAVAAVQLCHAVFRNIKQNLFWAFIYNLLMVPVAGGALYAAFGWSFTPPFAALTMAISSICVILNALRLKKYKSKFFRKADEEEKIPEQINFKVAPPEIPPKTQDDGDITDNNTENVEGSDVNTAETDGTDEINTNANNEQPSDVQPTEPEQPVNATDMAISNIAPALECLPDYTTQIPIITQEMLEGKYDFSKMPYTVKKSPDDNSTVVLNVQQNTTEKIRTASTVPFNPVSVQSVPEQDMNDGNESNEIYSSSGNAAKENSFSHPENNISSVSDISSNSESEKAVEIKSDRQDEEEETVDISAYEDYDYRPEDDYVKDDMIKDDYAKIMMIGGNLDENSADKIEDALNSLQGVNAIMDVNSATVRIYMDRDYMNETLSSLVENAGFMVISISNL
ncbi:MAG: heavy metal translocating P-type ATPase [Acutalibacteraceae bacterium]